MDLLKDARSLIHRSHDFLGQAEALDTLLEATQEIRPPACMALYGSWGAGKTALMRSAFEELNRPTSPHCAVWFDPWPYERHEDVLTMLVVSMVTQLGLDEGLRAEFRDRVVQLLKPLLSIVGRMAPALIAVAAGDLSAAGTLGFNRLEPEKLANLIVSREGPQDDVKALRAGFSELAQAALENRAPTARLVVFLDDLDRCLPERAVWLIEATKLLLADPTGDAPAVFIFGLDRQIVGEAIRVRYPASTLYTGENYLEKIFDLSLEAPPVRPNREALMGFIRHVGGGAAIQSIEKAFAHGAGDLIDVLCDPVFANPRVIKRAINRLYLLTKNRTLPEMTLAPRRCFAWVAGTERFRTFRHFFAQASEDELVALDTAVSAASGRAEDPSRVSSAVRAFVDTPGFIGFYRDLLGLKKRNTPGVDLLAQRTRSATGTIATLLDLDDVMRSVGL